MFRVGVQSPQVLLWQARFNRLPRWAWMIIGIAVIVPLVILLLIALTAGIAVAAVVACILTLRNVARRLIHPGRPAALARRDVFSARDVIVVERVDVPGSQVNH